jgi:protein-tyrosine-phosphatase
VDRPRNHRVLVICEGNTCRSPVLACLLLREAHRFGRTDLDIQSAGSDVHKALQPNEFAKEALKMSLDPNDYVSFKEIIHRLQTHESHSLKCYGDQSFDLIVSLVDPESLNLDKLRITAPQVASKKFEDCAWREWQDHNCPETLAEDHTGQILEKYSEQTALLAAYARELAETFLI